MRDVAATTFFLSGALIGAGSLLFWLSILFRDIFFADALATFQAESMEAVRQASIERQLLSDRRLASFTKRLSEARRIQMHDAELSDADVAVDSASYRRTWNVRVD